MMKINIYVALVIIAILFMVVGMSSCSGEPTTSSDVCSKSNIVVYGMVDCLDYLTAGSKQDKPSPSCCTGLQSVLNVDPHCVCVVINMCAQFGYKLNLHRAAALTSACAIKPAPPISTCAIDVAPTCSPRGLLYPPSPSPELPSSPSPGSPAPDKTPTPPSEDSPQPSPDLPPSPSDDKSNAPHSGIAPAPATNSAGSVSTFSSLALILSTLLSISAALILFP